MNNDAIVLLSGGIDSAACAWFLRDHGHSVRGLFVDYGQKAARLEKNSAEALSKVLEIALDCVSLTSPVEWSRGSITKVFSYNKRTMEAAMGLFGSCRNSKNQ